MFDGEEIPQKNAEGEQSEEQTGDAEITEPNFSSTSQDGPETIQLQVLPTTSQNNHETLSIPEHEVPDPTMETQSTKALQVVGIGQFFSNFHMILGFFIY